MPPFARSPAVARFERLHGVTGAVVRLFAAGDWTIARGRAVEAELRALLLTWASGGSEGEGAIDALLAALDGTDLFDPAVIADRGPFLERLLSLRDRSMLAAANARPQWQVPPWGAAEDPADARDAAAQRFAGLLSRAFTRLYSTNLRLGGGQVIVSVADRDGTIVEANEAFCRTSGYRRDELVGAKHSILKSGRHPCTFYDELWRTISSGRIWTGEICNRRKDGSYYWLQSTIIPVLGPDGEPEEYVSVRSEISADKWCDERLAVLERAILSSTSGVVVADALRPELPITWASPSFARLLGRDEHELHGLPLRDVLASGQPADVFDRLDELLQSAEGGSLLVRGVRRDGTRSALDVRLSPMRHTGVTTHVVGVASDASRLEAMREALQDREERLRRGEESAGFGTWDWDIATGSLHWSASVGSLFGLPHGEIETTYERFLDLVHPGDRPRVRDAVEACLTLDRPYELEHRCVWNDGTLHWLHESGRVVRDERGRPAKLLGVVRDVTERRCLLAELQRERERLAHTQALSRLGDWRIDARGNDAWWSATVHAIYHRDPSSFRPCADTFVHAADPEDAPLVEQALHDARNGDDTDCLHRIALPAGERRWVRLRAHPQSDEFGAVVAVTGTVQDVTDALHRDDCARLLRRVMAMGEDAVAIADRHGEIVFANAAWRRSLGHDESQRPGGALLAACETPVREALEREIRRADPAFRHRADLPMRRADGTRLVVRSEIGVTHDALGNVQYFVHRFRDARVALAHEHALAELQARLEQAREAGCRLVARTGEALHGPAQSVLAFARLLAERPGLSGVAHQYLRHVLQAGRRMLDTIGDMLDLSRAEAGRLSFRIEAFPLDEAFGDLLEPGPDGSPAIGASIEPGERLAVRSDRMRLVQALRALLADASKPSLAAQRAAGMDDDADSITIRVVREIPATAADGGRRLAALLLARLDGTLETPAGVGGVDGRDASGTRSEALVLRLPSAPLDACPGATRTGIAPAGSDAGVPSGALRRRVVLYVDDDLAGLSLLQEAFRVDSRVRLLPSPSALLGLELARTQCPDVVLLDIDSVAVDAFAVLRELKIDARTRRVPVIAITADASEPNRQRIDAAGFFRFVEKPLSLPELLRTIDAALHARRDLTRTER